MRSLYSTDGPPVQLVDWLQKSTQPQLRHSIAIGSRCNADLPSIGAHVAVVLNLQSAEDQRLWQPFCMQDLWRLAGDPTHRLAILENLPPDRHPGAPDSDIDRIARRLARVGGAILEGQYSLDATVGLANTYRVCLCEGVHPRHGECHITFRPADYPSRRSLANAIADAFLKWEASHPVSSDFNRLNG